MEKKFVLTSDLARAARAFTKVSAGTIGKAAELSKEQVRDFERGIIDLSADDRDRLQASLEQYGALFIPEDDHAGYGVRRRMPRAGYLRLNAWEGEGGQ